MYLTITIQGYVVPLLNALEFWKIHPP